MPETIPMAEALRISPIPVLDPSLKRAVPGVLPSPLPGILQRFDGPLAGRLRSGRELAAAAVHDEPVAAPWSAALPGLAHLLPGGLPRGELIEITAARSSGRFGCALMLLAAATSAGENAALIDLGDGLDPQSAALAGIDWPRLLWARPRGVREALAATEAALTGGLPLVVLDLGLPPLPGGRGAEAMWLRLARSARQHGALLVVASPYRVAGPAASTVLELGRSRALWTGSGNAPRLLAGADGRMTLAKAHRLLAPHGETLRLALPA
ncbi:MAG: hypothetical protein ABI639_10530 [Thermoanaerobaculia bacterium]